MRGPKRLRLGPRRGPRGRQVLSLLASAVWALLSLGTAARAGEGLRLWVLDVGTGLSVYGEVEPGLEAGRPTRFLYDLGKFGGPPAENPVVRFLTSPAVGLRAASGEDPGDVIDYVLLSHPHDDHYSAGAAVFEAFDVRSVIESKLSLRPRYLERFKVPALKEIAEGQRRGVPIRYRVVALPYPYGFDGERGGRAYDEYALCQQNLPPEFAAVACRTAQPGLAPFVPADQRVQSVRVPARVLVGDQARGLPEDLEVDVEVLPLGVTFPLGPGAELQVVHADTVAGLAPERNADEDYAAAWPYYSEADLNDGSLVVRVLAGRARVMLPGDAEGRVARPRQKASFDEVFGSGEGRDGYSAEDVQDWLRAVGLTAEASSGADGGQLFRIGSRALRSRLDAAFLPLDRVSPVSFTVDTPQGPRRVEAVDWKREGDVPPDLVDLSGYGEGGAPPGWRRGALAFHRSLKRNAQLLEAHRDRYSQWVRGPSPRLGWDGARVRLEARQPVWTVTNLVQLARQVSYVDPALSRQLCGMILGSDLFLQYVGEDSTGRSAARAERHMIDLADEVVRRGGDDPLRAEVLVLGHHGSFTSSSSEFVRRVGATVGIVSADDRSYGGSTLPDFSDAFWNLNSLHPGARRRLLITFLHADVLARARGAAASGATRSPTAARVFRARGRGPLALWRTDWNDDLWDANEMQDNILLEVDGKWPIGGWLRGLGRDQPGRTGSRRRLGLRDLWDSAPYLARQVMGLDLPPGRVVRAVDPSGELRLVPLPPPAVLAPPATGHRP